MTADVARDPALSVDGADEATAVVLNKLYDRLDALWLSYLHHLDAYTSFQSLIQKHMNAGFFSLARANFHPGIGVRRYGRDYYHDRPTASKRVKIAIVSDSDQSLHLEVHGSTSQIDKKTTVRDNNEENNEAAERHPSPPATPDSEHEAHNKTTGPSTSEMQATNGSDKATTSSQTSSDPLRWFGILIPQDLRASQSSFSSAMDEAVAGASNGAREMRRLEVDIRKLRKEIRKAEREAKS